VVGAAAEVDPVEDAERVGVAASGRHLLAGYEQDAGGRAGRREFGVVRDRVVVGHREEVEAGAGRQRGQRRDGQASVGMDRVRVQVAGQPGQSG
jgi:hypothetical protein